MRSNQGCAGIDGINIKELEPIFGEQWRLVADALQSGTYQPQAMKRVRIPKPSGSERLLAIPCVMDRVVQQASAQVFSTLWEQRFSDSSYGYRRGYGTCDAVEAATINIAAGYECVLHLDIENFFDSVPHEVAISAIAEDVADPLLMHLVQQTLRCCVYEDGLARPVTCGLAQGSPLSPVLANVVLHHLDVALESTKCPFVRYADDCVVFLHNQEEGVVIHDLISRVLAPLGLSLNANKTKLTLFNDARFLGFTFLKDARGKIVRRVSPESLLEIESACMILIESSPVGSAATDLADHLRGWLAYYYSAGDEDLLRAMLDRVITKWRNQNQTINTPGCLDFNALRPQSGKHSRNTDYSGHLHEDIPSPVDWLVTARCFLLRALQSRWWHLEYDIQPGRHPLNVRLCLGRHRINLRF